MPHDELAVRLVAVLDRMGTSPVALAAVAKSSRLGVVEIASQALL